MGWLGKVIGGTIGFALGGPIGAVAGAVFGHAFDLNEQKYLEGDTGEETVAELALRQRDARAGGGLDAPHERLALEPVLDDLLDGDPVGPEDRHRPRRRRSSGRVGDDRNRRAVVGYRVPRSRIDSMRIKPAVMLEEISVVAGRCHRRVRQPHDRLYRASFAIRRFYGDSPEFAPGIRARGVSVSGERSRITGRHQPASAEISIDHRSDVEARVDRPYI